MSSTHWNLDEYSLTAITPEHIENIRRWRNDQIDILRQSSPISAEQQVIYYRKHVWPTKSMKEPPNILLAFLKKARLIGYGGLVHIAWEHRRAEVSFLLDTQLEQNLEARSKLFATYLRLLKTVAFKDLGLHRLYSETYAVRTHHTKILEDEGFQNEGRMRAHVWIQGQPIDSIVHGCLSPYV